MTDQEYELRARLERAEAERDAYRAALCALQTAIERVLMSAPDAPVVIPDGWAQAYAWREVAKRQVVETCTRIVKDLNPGGEP